MVFVMGVDIGTTGVKATVIDENGHIRSTWYHEYKLYHREPHLSELNPEEVWTAIKETIRCCIKRASIEPKEIKAISTAVLGEAFVPVDREGKPLYWSMTTFDARAVRQVEEWMELISPEEMFRITGQPLSPKIPIYTLHKILWIRENKPEVYSRTWKFLCWEEYFNYKLTGECVTDYTIASRTMLLDIRSKKWSRIILELADLSEDLLPEVAPSGTLIGEVSEKGAREVGLNRGTLVVTGGHDQPLGALGSGLLEEGVLMDATGTVECYGVVEDELVLKDEMRKQGYALHPYTLKNKYFLFGFTPTGGAALRWYRDNFALEEKRIAETKGKSVYDIIVEEASTVPPGALGLFFYPYLEGSGTPEWNRDVRGCFIGLTLAHGKKEMIKSILESLAFELRANIEVMKGYGIRIDEVRAIGGGAKSPYWLQLKADVTGLRITVPSARMETTSVGAGILAFLGIGMYSSAREAVNSMCRIVETYEPREGLSKQYENIYKKYLQIARIVRKIAF